MEDVQVIIIVALKRLVAARLQPEAEQRLEQAVLEAKKYDRPYLILCGGYTGESTDFRAESTAAAAYLREHGNDKYFRRIILESSSRVTLENATFAMREIDRCVPLAQYRIIVAVSSAYHVRFFDQIRLHIDFASTHPYYVLTTAQAPATEYHNLVLGEMNGLPNARRASAADIPPMDRPPRYVGVRLGHHLADPNAPRILLTPFMLQPAPVKEFLHRARAQAIEFRLGITGRPQIPNALRPYPEGYADVILSGKISDEPDNPDFPFIPFCTDVIGVIANEQFIQAHEDLAHLTLGILEIALDEGSLIWPQRSIFTELLEKTLAITDDAILVDTMQIGVELVSSNLRPACMLGPIEWSRAFQNLTFHQLKDFPLTIYQGAYFRSHEIDEQKAKGIQRLREIAETLRRGTIGALV